MFSVVIVDDDVRVARNHRELVESVPGFEVSAVVHTMAEALAVIPAKRPDLVLMDLYLPDGRGMDLMNRLRDPRMRQSSGRVDVIVVSALRDMEHVREASWLGALYYLIKPFPLAALRDQLERYVGMRRRAEAGGLASQADVDGIFAAMKPQQKAQLPKGMAAPTIDLVVDTLREAGEDLSASEVSERTGLARVTARRYLEHLCAEGRAELGLRYGSAGRPEHRYRWTA
ncbi:response regulator [Nesterenkonia aerolata]|uniref:Transcriptional regulatory protein n=1 Tax=Nesterenkonia aerolata TaxID=3074079 RepID=A0ABU2DTP1_9MICC|nr:response regulator [Nesterenkonia sp. LY-0111]MDR8019873.1 response regulator [Nesterenkonia sp. LY-0111]